MLHEKLFCRLSNYVDSAVTILELYNCSDAIGKIIRLKQGGRLQTGRIHMAEFINGKGQKFDEGIVEFVPVGKSFSGLETVVISLHGGKAVYEEFRRVLNCEGYREIAYGERSKYALDNGKIDYVQYEAAELLLNALLPSQELFLSLNKEGLLSRYIKDATDEELAGLKRSIGYGKALSIPSKIVIAGKANVGKSTLFNSLVGRENALVFDREGTTLDYIDDKIEIGSFPFILYDTAGIKKPSSSLDVHAHEKLVELLDIADLVLYLSDYTVTLEEYNDFLDMIGGKKVLRVLNKIDVRDIDGRFDCKISLKDGRNLDLLRAEILRKMDLDQAWDKKKPLLFTQRQYDIVDSYTPLEDKKHALLNNPGTPDFR